MTRYKCIIEYDGTGYYGMQRQSDDIKTVQGELEHALSLYYNKPTTIDYSGRTDSGVHAIGQVIHFDAVQERSAYSISEGIKFHLRDRNKIAVKSVETVEDNFHSRFDAKKRFYIYKIINKPIGTFFSHTHWFVNKQIDVNRIDRAAQLLLGRHDFSAFRGKDCQSNNPIRTLDRIEVELVSLKSHEEINIIFEAKSFLHHMVRNIVGSLIAVGTGKRNLNWISEVLLSKNRSLAGQMAPAHGLYFWKVEY